MFKATVVVTIRPSILDPEGKAIEHALHSLALHSLSRVRVGKHIEMQLDTTSKDEAFETVDAACKKLLSNPVMEDYVITLQEMDR